MADLSEVREEVENVSIFDDLPDNLKSRITNREVLDRLSDIGFTNRTNFDNLYDKALAVYDSPRRTIICSVYDGMGHVRIVAADTSRDGDIYFTQLLGGSNDYDRMISYNNLENYNVLYFSLEELVDRLTL